MTATPKTKAKGLRGTESQAKTRLLLALWELGGAKEAVKKKDLTDRALLNNERVGDYSDIFEQLAASGAIALKTEKRVVQVSLQDKGLQILDAGLKSPEFEADGEKVKARDKDFNAVLRWFRGRETLNGAVSNFTMPGKAIASYDEFNQVALDVYDRLNRDYNMDNLVPIYRIRREIGDRVSRSQFNEWLLEMQANDIFQLMAGEMPDLTPDKRENSITIPGAGLRYYAKCLIY